MKTLQESIMDDDQELNNKINNANWFHLIKLMTDKSSGSNKSDIESTIFGLGALFGFPQHSDIIVIDNPYDEPGFRSLRIRQKYDNFYYFMIQTQKVANNAVYATVTLANRTNCPKGLNFDEIIKSLQAFGFTHNTNSLLDYEYKITKKISSLS